MLSLTRDPLTQTLRETNQRLRYWLDGLAPGPAEIPVATPEQMAGLLSELLRAGEWLRALPQQRDGELEAELTAYRKNVERLREILPFLHGQLLRERAYLEEERTRIASIAQWVQGSRQTL